MKGQLIGNFLHTHSERGSSTLEMLIAFAILITTITSVIVVGFGNQSITIDTQTNTEALYKAHALLEDARALSRQDFLGVEATTSIETLGELSYTKTLAVMDITQCKKQATSTVSWNTASPRPQKIELSTYFTDITLALALGGDCLVDAPTSTWTNPTRFASDTFSPGKPTAIDVQHRFAYVGLDKEPFLYIASTTYATLGQSGGLFVTYTNGFNLGNMPNAVDAINDNLTGKKYVFAGMDTTTNQLRVIDVTDSYNPQNVATSSLDDAAIPVGERVSGSQPQAQVVYYYDHKLYLGFNRTSGPEFHVFDVTDPTAPVWLGSREMNHNVNNIIVRGNYAYLAMTASDANDKELAILDVSDPTDILPHFVNGVPEEWGHNASGTEDGLSLALIGNKLYLGREGGSALEPDFFILNVSAPTSTLDVLGSMVLGSDIIQIRIAERFAFLGTSKTNEEFQIWNIMNPANLSLIKAYNFGNNVKQGFDYEPDFIYATGQSTPNFQILYSP